MVMAINERPKTKERTVRVGRPDFAAISRRSVKRNRLALKILEASDRGDTEQVEQLRRAG
jgi:hypothetical protein